MQSTKLCIVMQQLHINVAELADAIHVHPSLVSRWKNGSRYFNVDSEHFTHILEYIVNRDSAVEYKNLEVFLKQYDGSLCLSSREAALKALKTYLSLKSVAPHVCSGESFSRSSSGEVTIYEGGREKRNALLSFFDFAMTFPPGRNVYIMLGSDVDSFLDVSDYYERWTERLHSIIEHGHYVHYLYNYSFTTLINNLKNFFWLFTHDYFFGYINNMPHHVPSNLFIIDEALAMADFANGPQEKRIPLFSFSSRIIVDQLKKQYLLTSSNCQMLKDPALAQSAQKSHYYMKKRINAEEDLYVYDEFPFCFPVSPGLIEEILIDNRLPRERVSACLEHYRDLLHKPAETRGTTGQKRYILNCETLPALAGMAEYRFPPNLFSDGSVVISRAYFHRFLREILAYINLPAEKQPFKIAMIENNHIADNGGMMAMVKNHLFTFVYPYFSASEKAESMLFVNDALISDAYHYFDALWLRLPPECKSANVMKAHLKNAIESLI